MISLNSRSFCSRRFCRTFPTRAIDCTDNYNDGSDWIESNPTMGLKYFFGGLLVGEHWWRKWSCDSSGVVINEFLAIPVVLILVMNGLDTKYNQPKSILVAGFLVVALLLFLHKRKYQVVSQYQQEVIF